MYKFIVKDIPFTNNTEIDVDVLIAVDCADKKRLGNIEYLFKNTKEIIKIDHHLVNDNYGTLNIVDPEISSTCELIAKILFSMDAEIDINIATVNLMGILSDTGRYLYKKVNSSTFDISSKLIELGAAKDLLMNKLFQSFSLNSLKATNEIINNAEFYFDDFLVITSVDNDLLNKYKLNYSDVENAINYYRDAEEVEISCMIKETEHNFFKISFRSKNIDVNEIAESFGGGGHKNASGCTIKGNLATVKNKITERLKNIEF